MPVVTMPDGQPVTFPDDMPPDQIRGMILKKFPDAAKSATQTAPKAPASPVVDAARSVPGGLAKGAAAVAGIPGDLERLADIPAKYITDKLGIGNGKDPGYSLPSSGDTVDAVGKAAGGYYQPQTQAGKYAETIASFAPAALSPGSLAKRATRVLIPGAASEAVGQIGQAVGGDAGEAYGRTIGALAGGAAQGAGEGVLAERAASAKVPTTAQVKGSANYSQFASKPVTMTPEATAALSDSVGQTAIQHAMNEAQINQEHGLVNEFKGMLSGNRPATVTTEAADKIRQSFDSLAHDAGTPNEARGWSKRSDAMETSIQQTPEINDARNAWGQYRKSQILDKAMQQATDTAGTPAGMGDPAQAMRREFLKVTRSAKFGAFSPDEQDAIKAVANGTPLTNALQQLGKFSPVRSQITRWMEIGGGAAGFTPEAIGIGAGGEVARQGSNFATARAARLASELVRSGGSSAPQLGSKVARGVSTSGALSADQIPDDSYANKIRSLSIASQTR